MLQLLTTAPAPRLARVAPQQSDLQDLYSMLDGFDGDVDLLSFLSHNCYRGPTPLPIEDVPF